MIDKNDKSSPMMRHYENVKEQYKDCILFYRLGDFYELFNEDAIEISKVLDLTLTGKNCGREERAPMCGVPYHAAEGYIAKLVQMGYKVAICEQLTDPKPVCLMNARITTLCAYTRREKILQFHIAI